MRHEIEIECKLSATFLLLTSLHTEMSKFEIWSAHVCLANVESNNAPAAGAPFISLCKYLSMISSPSERITIPSVSVTRCVRACEF